MDIDHISLQFVIALLAAIFCAVLLAAWAVSKKDRFLATGAMGLVALVAAQPVFIAYIDHGKTSLALPAFSLMLVGLSMIEGASSEFASGNAPFRRIIYISLASIAAITPFFLLGISGAGTALFNLLAGALLMSSGLHYRACKEEAPTLTLALISLYFLVGLSFLICAIDIMIQTPIYRTRDPNNWAENLNAIASIVCLTSICAISLILNQSRTVAALRQDAQTDPLTGVKNRRVLFDMYDGRPLPAGTAVAVFDLDHFKKINDQYGHAAGDDVLRYFGQILLDCEDKDTTVARTGGEEFVLVMSGSSPIPAHARVDQIRQSLIKKPVSTKRGAVTCTVSVGVSFATGSKSGLDSLLDEADRALYLAKRNGRNQVVVNGVPAVA